MGMTLWIHTLEGRNYSNNTRVRPLLTICTFSVYSGSYLRSLRSESCDVA